MFTPVGRRAQLGPGPSASTHSDRADFWTRSLRGWDIAFYALWLLAVVAYLLEQPVDGLRRGLALTAFGVLLVAYFAIGRRAAHRDDSRLALAYLLVMFVCVVSVVSLALTGTLLLFIAYSQVWYFAASRRQGGALTVVLTVLVFTAIGCQADVDSLADVGALAVQAVMLVAFAALLGLWITQVAEQSEERADLLERLEEAQAEVAESHHAAGVVAERERMAREIHDTLAQGFTSVIMLAQTAEADLGRDDPERAAERLTLIERTARENLAEARALVAASAPVGLDGSTLIEALERLARRFSQETGVPVTVTADDVATLATGREQEVVLLRAAQEALSNVRRHAHADAVRLVLSRDGANVRLEVVDDGRGMNPASVEGFGLRGMRERVASGGGELAVDSTVGQGTRVRVTMPATEET